MNDAPRELRAELGIALMGSLAASRYTSSLTTVTAHLPAAVRHQARVSLADALGAAAKLGGPAGRALRAGAEHAFINGIQLPLTPRATLAPIPAAPPLFHLPPPPPHATP